VNIVNGIAIGGFPCVLAPPSLPRSWGANAAAEEHLWKWHMFNTQKCAELGRIWV